MILSKAEINARMAELRAAPAGSRTESHTQGSTPRTQEARIRGEPSVHLDETGWNLFRGDGYRRSAWTMIGGTSDASVFFLGDSIAVVVSDDYGAYRRSGKIS